MKKNYVIILVLTLFVLILIQFYKIKVLENKLQSNFTKELKIKIDSVNNKIKYLDKDLNKLKKTYYNLKNEIKKKPIIITPDIELDSIRAILKGHDMSY